MTGRQFRDLEPGDRVAWRGHDPEDGTVIANGRTLLVAWDSGGATEHTPLIPELVELAPTAFDQVRR